jgi:hypothetical protein
MKINMTIEVSTAELNLLQQALNSHAHHYKKFIQNHPNDAEIQMYLLHMKATQKLLDKILTYKYPAPEL